MALKSLWIALDHAGFTLKTSLKALLRDLPWNDLGPSHDGRIDYPDQASKVAPHVARDPRSLGVLICGSGIGVAIAANKVAGIRAATVENATSARLAREHNDANILCLGARFLAPDYAAEIVRAWLNASPPGKERSNRHRQRILKISKMEKRKS